MLRQAFVAGQFYPADKVGLTKQLEILIEKKKDKAEAKAVIMPHAGYIYSGAVAGKTISQVKVKDSIIILGPNHTGLGQPYSVFSSGTWQTPLGDIKINEPLAELLIKNSQLIKLDLSAHLSEHSIEVELPFLQYFNPNFRFVPMIISDINLNNFKKVGEEIAEAIKQNPEPTLIVASSDMTHYEQQETAKDKDKIAIEAILELSPEKLLESINKFNISMCGFAPVIVTLFASKRLGAKKATLIAYQTSGETSGDYSSVVGYAGVVIN